MRPKLRGSSTSRAVCKAVLHNSSQTSTQIITRRQRTLNTMSLRYAAILAPACAFTHPQQPRRIVLRRDYSSIDDVFDSMFDDAFDAWSPFGLSRRRDPWSPFGMRRRSPLAQQFGQLKRLSQAFEEQLQRVDEDDFLADTPLGQRRQLETKEDAPATKDGEAPKAEGDEAVAPAAPRGYAYSWSSSSVTQNGETRTTVRKNFKDGHGAAKSFQERSLARDGKKLTETRTQGFGDAEAKLSFEGVGDAQAFESAWATKPALPAAEAPAAEAPEPNKEELAADAEIAKLKAELKALRGDPLPPADYGTTQV